MVMEGCWLDPRRALIQGKQKLNLSKYANYTMHNKMAKVNQWRAGQLDSSFDMIQNMQFFIQNLHKMCTQN